MVEVENLERIENFRVTMMCEAIQEMRVAGVVIWAPEPSLLQWDLAVEDLGGWFENDVKVTEPPQRRTRLIVPGNYLEDNVETIKKLEARVMKVGRSQEALDPVHEDWW